jgi:tRNA pseudouridine55 synthase
MTGVINFLKPPGMTSFDAVAWLRRLLNVKKAGHCGTLDPDAAGVLPVCVGAATGITELLSGSGKAYRVEAVAGLSTDTLDTSGRVLDRGADEMPEQSAFEAALASFTGVTEQIPPMYSAIKVGGRKLYKLARSGVETELTPRVVEIYSTNIVYYGKNRVIFDVACSKGTYIRSLCRDLGEKLGIYLCMSFLLRTMSAGLSIDDSLTAEYIAGRIGLDGAGAGAGTGMGVGIGAGAGTGMGVGIGAGVGAGMGVGARPGAGAGAELSCDKGILIPADRLLRGYPAIDLPDSRFKQFMNGAQIALNEIIDSGGLLRVYYGGRFLGLAQILSRDFEKTYIRVKKFLIEKEGR